MAKLITKKKIFKKKKKAYNKIAGHLFWGFVCRYMMFQPQMQVHNVPAGYLERSLLFSASTTTNLSLG